MVQSDHVWSMKDVSLAIVIDSNMQTWWHISIDLGIFKALHICEEWPGLPDLVQQCCDMRMKQVKASHRIHLDTSRFWCQLSSEWVVCYFDMFCHSIFKVGHTFHLLSFFCAHKHLRSRKYHSEGSLFFLRWHWRDRIPSWCERVSCVVHKV